MKVKKIAPIYSMKIACVFKKNKWNPELLLDLNIKYWR